MDVYEAITSRASVTKYRDQGVPREKIARILESARHAPSAGNMQSWEYIVITDDETLDTLAQYAHNQPHVREAPVAIVIMADLEKADRRYGDRGKDLYAVQETAAAMENMLLAAHAEDLGAAWVGAFDERPVKDLLEIPDNVRPLAIITLGFPAEIPEQPNKFPVTGMTYLNRYGRRVHPIYEKIEWKGLENYGSAVKKKAKKTWRKMLSRD